MNKVFLVGRLTKDPEIRVTRTQQTVANFSIAVDDGKDKQGNKLTQFINCTAWEKIADIIKLWAKKGTMLAIVGKIHTHSWEKPDGNKAYATEIQVKEVQLLASNQDKTTRVDTADKQASPADDEIDLEDVMPDIDITDLVQ